MSGRFHVAALGAPAFLARLCLAASARAASGGGIFEQKKLQKKVWR